MMKKNAVRFTAMSMTAAMALTTAGCSAKVDAASLAGKVIDANKDVTSLTYQATIDVEGSLDFTDYDTSSNFSVSVDSDNDMTIDPMMVHSTSTVSGSMGGETNSSDTESYMEAGDNEVTVYTESDGTWTKTSVDLDEDTMAKMTDFSYNEVLQNINDGSLEATLQDDTETYNDAKCYVLSTSADGSMLSNAMSSLDPSTFSDLGMDEEDLQDVSVDVTYYINAETYQLAGIVIDGKEFGNAVFASALDNTDISSTVGSYTVDLSKFDITMDYSDYNNVDAIEIPSDAQDAEEATSSSLFSSSSTSSSYSSNSYSSSSSTNSSSSTSDTTMPSTNGNAEMPATADWTQMVFALDDKVWQIPFSYPDLSSDWSFNLADYGYTDGYVTNAGDQTYATVQLSNPTYDMDFMIGLINLTNGTQDITENDVWAVDMSIEWANSYPSLTLPGGIHWGSTLEEIEAVYGQPTEDPYYSDSLGYYSIDYQTSDYNKVMELTVYDDGGLKAVRLEDYSL
jgi:hypothetical protein